MNTENCDCVYHIPISFFSPGILHATVLVLKHSAYPVLNAPELYTCNLKCMIVKRVFLVSPVSVVSSMPGGLLRVSTVSYGILLPSLSISLCSSTGEYQDCYKLPSPSPQNAVAPKKLISKNLSILINC